MTKSIKRTSNRAQTTAAAKAARRRPSRKPEPVAECLGKEGGTLPRSPSKLSTLIDLMSRPQGATINDLIEATGWQAHSIRGAIAGALKKQRGLTVASEATEQGRTYRVIAEATS